MRKISKTIAAVIAVASMLMPCVVFADEGDLTQDIEENNEAINHTNGYDVFINASTGTISHVNSQGGRTSEVVSNIGTIYSVEAGNTVFNNSSDGTVSGNAGTVQENYGTVHNDGGTVEVNYPGATVDGTGIVAMNLGNGATGSNTKQKQLWEVQATDADWDLMAPSGTAGQYWVKETSSYQVWLLDSTGVLSLQSRNPGKRITNISFQAGGDQAAVTLLGNGIWQVSGITELIHLLNIAYEDIPTPQPAPEPEPTPQPAPEPELQPQTPAPMPPLTVSPAVPSSNTFFETIEPALKVSYIRKLTNNQLMIVDAAGVHAVKTTPISDKTLYRNKAILDLMQSGYPVSDSLSVKKGVVIAPALGGTDDVLMKVAGLKKGDMVWLMFVDNAGNTKYYAYLVTEPNVIETSVSGFGAGGTFVVLK